MGYLGALKRMDKAVILELKGQCLVSAGVSASLSHAKVVALRLAA